MLASLLQNKYDLSATFECFNYDSVHQIGNERDQGLLKYILHKEDFPSKQIRWYEELDYGNAFETQTGCGVKTYEISCDNSLFGDDVVWLTDEGHLVISPYMVQSDDIQFADCDITAYFADYHPDDIHTAEPNLPETFHRASPWARGRISIDMNLWFLKED